MKRGAERQLTKDDDDNDIEEIQDPLGFQKADEASLARRQIRALPKRALAASKPPALNGLPPALASDVDRVDAAAPKFGGFVGFGAGTSASNPFTFIAQHASVSPSNSSQSTSPLPPIFVSPFSGASKQSPLNPDASPPNPATSPSAEEVDSVALKYFKSLRGLNVSFLSAISTAVEKDPFFDVASLAESYKNLRTTIQSEFDGSSQPSQSTLPTNPTPVTSAKAPSEKAFSMFSVPKSSVGSVEASSPPSEGGTKTGGFTFPPFVPPSTTTQQPFGLTSKTNESFPSSSTTLPEPPKSAFKFATSSTSTTSSSPPSNSGFSFAPPSSIQKATSESASDSLSKETESSSAIPPSSTTNSFGSTNVPNFFSAVRASASSTSDAVPKPTSAFGGSIFGSSSATESSKLLNTSASDSKDNSKVTTTLFGNGSPSTSTSVFGSSDKSVNFFGSASPPKPGAFAFGRPGGSIGNPVGFGFGSSSPSAADGSPSPGFIFGAPLTKPSESIFSPPITDKSSDSTPQPEVESNEDGGEDDAVKLLPSHTHDEEGEGEQDEDTTYTVKCKVYRLSRLEDKSEWKDLGVGMLRLKKHKETNVRRVLMRNSSTGRILINFRMYGGLKPSLAKTAISFIGYESDTPTSFRIRVKTEEQAEGLKQAMEREIAAVQATM